MTTNTGVPTCIHGHPLTPDNTYTSPDGRKRCRTCNRDSVRRSQAKPRPTCTLDYCDRPARNIHGGYCTGHLQQLGRGEQLRPLQPRGGDQGGHRHPRNPDTLDCDHPGCTLAGWRPKAGQHWCEHHVPATPPKARKNPQPKVKTAPRLAETPTQKTTRTLPATWDDPAPRPKAPAADKHGLGTEIWMPPAFDDAMQTKVAEFTDWLTRTGRNDIAQALGLIPDPETQPSRAENGHGVDGPNHADLASQINAILADGGTVNQAADELGRSINSIRSIMRRYHIYPPRDRTAA